MAKAKKAKKSVHPIHRVHKKLEQPVHSTLGYLVLLGLAVVVLAVVMKFLPY